MPSHELKVAQGRLLARATPSTPRKRKPHAAHPLARPVKREPGPVRVMGISTTAQDPANSRFSTSEFLLGIALNHARQTLSYPTKLLKLAGLKFRACEGYYSKSAQACTWPCSITQMDATDELTEVYEAMVHWADVVLLATPIRWGQASSLYFKLAERLNCVQNQVTIKDRVIIRRKVAGFIITAGRTTSRESPASCWDFSRNLDFTCLSSHSSPTRAVGRRKIWSATSPKSSRARSCAPEPAGWRNVPSPPPACCWRTKSPPKKPLVGDGRRTGWKSNSPPNRMSGPRHERTNKGRRLTASVRGGARSPSAEKPREQQSLASSSANPPADSQRLDAGGQRGGFHGEQFCGCQSKSVLAASLSARPERQSPATD